MSFYAKDNKMYMTRGDYGIPLPLQLTIRGGTCASGLLPTDIIILEICKGPKVLVSREKTWSSIMSAEGVFLLELSKEESLSLPLGVYTWRIQLRRGDLDLHTVIRSTLEVLSGDMGPTAMDQIPGQIDLAFVDLALAVDAATGASSTAQKVQAGLHLRQHVFVGPASAAEGLRPGDVLVVTDGQPITGGVGSLDLLREAQKAAAGAENALDTMAVLSVINATNWRRDADGLLWTTDTVPVFRTQLTAFAAAAVAAGYVDEGGAITATWAQAQAWFLEKVLITPLEAEDRDYPWRTAPPKSRLDDALEEIAAIKGQLQSAAGVLMAIAGGGPT